MLARLTFAGIVAFWLTMNFLLWRLEFGAQGSDTAVPVELVWRKILTAPDASSLSVYQKGERMGYCEINTEVGRQMATFDEGKPPPEGFAIRTGYQLHLAGNISLGEFTNRVKFDARLRFDPRRQWQELNLRITARTTVIEVNSLATNGMAHINLSSDGATLLRRDVALADIQSPGAAVRLLAGTALGEADGMFDPAEVLPADEARKIAWVARRTRMKIGAESVPVYRLETSVLGRVVTMDVSTLGEILRVDLPGGLSAHIDEWSKP